MEPQLAIGAEMPIPMKLKGFGKNGIRSKEGNLYNDRSDSIDQKVTEENSRITCSDDECCHGKLLLLYEAISWPLTSRAMPIQPGMQIPQ